MFRPLYEEAACCSLQFAHFCETVSQICGAGASSLTVRLLAPLLKKPLGGFEPKLPFDRFQAPNHSERTG